MKQNYKNILAGIIAVWIFAMGFVLGQDKGIEDTLETANIQQTEAQVAEKPTKPNLGGSTTTGGTSTGDTSTGDTSTDNNTATPVDPTMYSQDQIIQMMNYYVNLVKAETDMTATKSETITVKVTDCSVPSLVGTINSIVEGIIGDGAETETYKFTASKEPGGGTPFSLIPPTNKEFLITAEGVASASVTKDENGNYVYTVVLVPESTTISSPEPYYNATAIGYLNLAGLDIAPAEISEADMYYPGSTVSVTIDAATDKVIKLHNQLPMTGSGKASLYVASGQADFEGALDETWTFTY